MGPLQGLPFQVVHQLAHLKRSNFAMVVPDI
jgi:hypothetical protein